MRPRKEGRQPGEVLNGRFVIAEVLGRGGMGTVYRARQLVLDRPVAIKEMDLDGGDERRRAAALLQFQQEARLLSMLHHPNLVQVLDYFTEGDCQYLALELIEGHPLSRMIPSPPNFLAEDTVLSWMEQVADVLEYLHGHDPPVIYRDLKPGNIMLDVQKRIKLIDFGIARLVDGSATATSLKGAASQGFAPPEQHLKSTDRRTDVYGFGATLYNLLTGEVPPHGVVRLVEDTLIPPRRLNPAISVPLEQAILAMLALKPEQRPDSIAAVRQALKVGGRLPAAAPTRFMAAPATRMLPSVRTVPLRPLAWATGGLLVAGLAGGGFWFTHQSLEIDSDPPGARVTLADGTASGTTPVRLEGLRWNQRVEGRLELDGHESQAFSADVSQHGVLVTLPLLTSTLWVSANQEGYLRVDGQNVGMISAKPSAFRVAAGHHVLSATAQETGWNAPQDIEVTVPAQGSAAPQFLRFRPRPAVVVVHAEGAQWVTVTGDAPERGPDASFTVRAGAVTVKAQGAGRQTVLRDLETTPGVTSTVTMDLPAAPALAPEPVTPVMATPEAVHTVVIMPAPVAQPGAVGTPPEPNHRPYRKRRRRAFRMNRYQDTGCPSPSVVLPTAERPTPGLQTTEPLSPGVPIRPSEPPPPSGF